MGIVELTRPDNSRVIIVVGEIVSFTTVPTEGPLTGPLTTGTRIVFRNQTHQDVKEDLDTVARMVLAALNQTNVGAAAAHAAALSASGFPFSGVMTNIGGHPDW